MLRTRSSAALPSGMWDGHYRQHFFDNPQAMTLEFADGIIRGDGNDHLGDFMIDGEYRIDRWSTRLGWIKTYERAHSVLYLGTFDGNRIAGKWSVRQRWGKFELHPSRKGLL